MTKLQKPEIFNLPQKGGGQSHRRDVVATVMGYALDQGVMRVKEVATGREYYVQIDPRSEVPNVPQAAFVGGIIDARMQKNLPVGSPIVLERLIDFGEKSAAGSKPENPLWVRWINSAPTDPSKRIEGIITITGGKDRAYGVQVWDRQAVRLDNLESIKDRFDQAVAYDIQSAEHYAKTGQRLPIKGVPGVQFRAVVDGKVVAFSPPVFDHRLVPDLPPEEKYKPLGFDEIKQAAAYYAEYFKERYPNAEVEVVLFTNYPASRNLTYPENSPLERMAGARINLEHDSDQTVPMALACEGVVILSPGALNPRTGERIGAENQWGNNVYASGEKFSVHERIADANGQKVTLSDGLKITYPFAKTDQEAKATSVEENKPTDETHKEDVHADHPVDLEADDIMTAIEAFYEDAKPQTRSGMNM